MQGCCSRFAMKVAMWFGLDCTCSGYVIAPNCSSSVPTNVVAGSSALRMLRGCQKLAAPLTLESATP
eukprot:3776956-Amphidinium_carterae.1